MGDSDGHGHGTHCSGTVAGLGANSKGVVGVIPDNMDGKFQLVIGKALSDSGSGSNSGVLGAVQSCVDNGAKVISLSLGGGGYSSTSMNSTRICTKMKISYSLRQQEMAEVAQNYILPVIRR